MPTNGQAVKIAHYTRSKFNSLTTKDSATIYYVEEPDGKIKQYIGNTHVVSDITKAEIEAKLTGNITSHTHSAATKDAAGFLSAGDKTKLDGIETGAQKNVGTNLSQGARNTFSLRIDSSTGDNFTIPSVNASYAGLMTSTDKNKLDGIETGAQKNVATNLSFSRTTS